MEIAWTYILGAISVLGFYSFLALMSTSTFINEMVNGTMFERIATLRRSL
jgi:hypothetical protein